MTGGQLAVVVIGSMVGACVIVWLVAQRILRKRDPSSRALRQLPAREARFIVLVVVVILGAVTLLRLAPEDSEISSFLSTWYGWPVFIAAALVGVYVVTCAVTFVRLLLKARDDGV